jgi:hypothetical protein
MGHDNVLKLICSIDGFFTWLHSERRQDCGVESDEDAFEEALSPVIGNVLCHELYPLFTTKGICARAALRIA